LEWIVDAAKEPSVTTLWPVWVSIGLPLILVALISTPLGPNFVFVMIGIPTLLLVWGVLGIWALIFAVRHLLRREWQRASICAALPFVVLVAGVWHRQFLHLCNDGGDIGYFIAKRSAYLEEIRITPPDGEPQLLVFNRGGMIWASRGYVYDESDEIMRNEPLRSANWRTRADGTELTCGFYAQPFPGRFSFAQHWYLASFNC
jgi:hypothetical protein